MEAVFSIVLACGCKKTSAPQQAPAPVAVESAKPIDHLAPGELAEGTEKAFGLLLPKGMHVNSAFGNEVAATGNDVPYGPLVDYLHARVRGGSLKRNSFQAIFDQVKVPGAPDRVYSIFVRPRGTGSFVSMVDETPAEPPPAADQDERMRQVGLTKSGKLLDPTHLH